MKGTKFLFAIAAGVVILVAALLILALLCFGHSPYQAEDTPEGVAHNYLAALQRQDYERARSYLSTTLDGYPVNVEQFAADVEQFMITDIDRPPYDPNWYKDEVSLIVESARVEGDDAWAIVRRTRIGSGDLFDSGQGSYTFSMGLRREDGDWKLLWAEWYWSDCWSYRSYPRCH